MIDTGFGNIPHLWCGWVLAIILFSKKILLLPEQSD